MTADHVAEALRRADRDRYFATLFLPETIRADAQALYAFNAEVASVRERAKEPAPGEIRLQWWVDAIKGQGHGAVRASPIAAALLSAIERHKLPTVPLLRLIAARRFDLYDDPMPDVQTFEGYAGETVAVLYQFIAMMLNGDAVVEDGDAAGHLGVAHALIGHLRAFGFNAARGRIFLPWALLAANGVSEQEVFARIASEGMLAAHAQLCDLAKDHLDRAEVAIGRLPKALRSAFAPLPVLRTALRQVAKHNATPFAPVPDRADWRKIGAMALWVWRNS